MAGLLILYGGTFDPIHNGHMAVARTASTYFDADVHLLPSGDPPLRAVPRTDASQRACMVGLAVAGEPRLHLDTLELQRIGPSYTADTLLELRARSGPHQPLAWLVGEDAFAGLPRWHRWRELFDLCHWIIAQRADATGRAERGEAAMEAAWEPGLRQHATGRWADGPQRLRACAAGLVARLPLQLRPESSTGVRQRIADGGDWEAWVPPAVAAHIRTHRLYGVGDGPGRAGI